jgi:hypothetical protein
MAIFNETLEGRFNKLIQSLHGVKGHTPAPQITPEIGHHIILEDDRVEYHFLAGSTRYSSGRVVLLANAGFFGLIEFVNPANSGTLAVIEHLFVAPAVAGDAFIITLTGAAIATSPAFSFPLDTRESPTKQSALTNFINNSTLVGVSGNQVEIVATGAVSVDVECIAAQGIVLAPGGRLCVFGNVANQAVRATLIHRERAVSRDELISR